MTGFNTKAKNDNGEYEVKFYTDDRDKYKTVEEFCRKMIGHSKPKKNSSLEEALAILCVHNIKALDKATEALGKQIPKKIVYNGMGYFSCPNCGGDYEWGKGKFCPDCGQALDWGKENNE